MHGDMISADGYATMALIPRVICLQTIFRHCRFRFARSTGKLRNRLWHGNLDQGHGECVLRNREFATIVLDSLRHFDEERYDLDCAIVMPNHVHLLVQFKLPTTCSDQCDSWLHFTAYRINKRLGRKGAFWQSEPFDHLVRSGEQFAYLQRYIARNGIEANLPASDYLYWSRTSWNDAPRR
jgi:type I restriction enzyme R subunit